MQTDKVQAIAQSVTKGTHYIEGTQYHETKTIGINCTHQL